MEQTQKQNIEIEIKVNQTELTTKQEDLILNDEEFLDEDERTEREADYGDYMYEVMKDLQMESQMNKMEITQ